MNYYPVTDLQTDRQTESDAYEPTVQYAQMGSKLMYNFLQIHVFTTWSAQIAWVWYS